MTGARDGTNRLFVVEQGGRIKAYTQAGASLGTFLNISGSIASGGERGLLGLAFHPNYETNRKFYVYFTRKGGDIAINEYKAQTGNPEPRRHVQPPADPDDRAQREQQPQRRHARLRPGQLPVHRYRRRRRQRRCTEQRAEHRPPARQDPADQHQRHRRIGASTRSRPRTPSSGGPAATRSGRTACATRGGSRSTATRGDLWIGDVGQNRYEEIDRKQVTSTGGPAARGSNFGWRVVEGRHCYRPASGCSKGGKVMPVVEYSHAAATAP